MTLEAIAKSVATYVAQILPSIYDVQMFMRLTATLCTPGYVRTNSAFLFAFGCSPNFKGWSQLKKVICKRQGRGLEKKYTRSTFPWVRHLYYYGTLFFLI